MNKSLQLDFDAAFIENKDIAWLALNNSKPSRMKNHCLLINSSFEYATKNVNTSKDKVLEHLLNIKHDLVNRTMLHSKEQGMGIVSFAKTLGLETKSSKINDA